MFHEILPLDTPELLVGMLSFIDKSKGAGKPPVKELNCSLYCFIFSLLILRLGFVIGTVSDNPYKPALMGSIFQRSPVFGRNGFVYIDIDDADLLGVLLTYSSKEFRDTPDLWDNSPSIESGILVATSTSFWDNLPSLAKP